MKKRLASEAVLDKKGATISRLEGSSPPVGPIRRRYCAAPAISSRTLLKSHANSTSAFAH